MTPRTLVIATVGMLLSADAGLSAARLKPESVEAWNRYVAAVEGRRKAETGSRGPFLLMDRASDAAAERAALLRGERVIDSMEIRDTQGRSIDVPEALVHHWRGAVFVPGAKLDALMTTLATNAPPPGRDVLRSAILARGPASLKIFLRLERTKFVTVVLDTEHEVRFTRESPTRAMSASIATKIAEVEEPGTPNERTLPVGDDRGFLWKLNSYWRYEAVPGGVIAECESISLSRGVPFGFQTIASPLIGSAARESMARALDEVVQRAKPR